MEVYVKPGLMAANKPTCGMGVVLCADFNCCVIFKSKRVMQILEYVWTQMLYHV